MVLEHGFLVKSKAQVRCCIFSCSTISAGTFFLKHEPGKWTFKQVLMHHWYICHRLRFLMFPGFWIRKIKALNHQSISVKIDESR